jgi:hypothetical protein
MHTGCLIAPRDQIYKGVVTLDYKDSGGLVCLAILLLTSCALAACSGDDADSGAASSAAPASAATATTATATTAGTASTGSAPTVAASSASVSNTGAASSASNTAAAATAVSSTAASTASAVGGPTGALAPTKSIKQWTVCDGVTDDSAGAAKAFAAAANNAFTLVVDCPVRLHIASDIAKPIFIDDDTTVEFSGSGSFIVDNVLQPAFVIADSSNVTLTSWNVEYVGGLPVNPDVGGYEVNGQFVQMSGTVQPAQAFNNLRLTPWLTAHRNLTFAHGVTSEWMGPTNMSAVFFVTGDVSGLQVTGLKMYVPATAGGDRFIPMAFSLSQNYKANQAVTASTPATAQYVAVPHNLQFSNIEFDGTYMGWQGTAQNVVFNNIQSHRYGDLQDTNGATVGGVGKWFAPPHLFYLNYASDADPDLFNRNIQITSVVDDGPRIGVARDKGGSDTISGYALSLKLGCVSCLVNNYQTTRPDGFLDLLESNGLTITNATATYDSAFLNNLYPGWRFPAAAASANVTVRSVTLTDTAAATTEPPIGNAQQPGNQGFVLQNVTVGLNRWSGSGSLLPWFAGQGNDISLQYTAQSTLARYEYAMSGAVSLTLQAQPYTVSPTQTTQLSWVSQSASGCTASGAWAGAMGSKGSQLYKPSTAGAMSFSLGCLGSGGTSAQVALALEVL